MPRIGKKRPKGATPLSNAEKQRQYRARRNQDPDRRREYLEKKKQKYQDDIEVGKRKRVPDMTDREKRKKRKAWRKEKQDLRKRSNNNLAQQALTPPGSPDNINNAANNHHNISTRVRRRKLAKCYRQNEKLRNALSTQKKLSQKYLMRLRREKARKHANDSPRGKVTNLLRHWTTSDKNNTSKQVEGKTKVRRSLLYHYALKKELRLKYSQANKKEKKSLAEILKGKVMKQYRLIKQAYKEIGICIGRYSVKTKGSLRKRLGPTVRTFYQRDDISRLTPGMKQTVTKNKRKMQKRILMSSLKDLHNTFLSENPDLTMSYTTFCRLRPFWVVQPSESDRDTCACKKHENTQYLVNALYKAGVLPSTDLQKILPRSVCDIKNIECMYGNYIKCKSNEIIDQNSIEIDNNKEVSWTQWFTKKEKRIIKTQEKEITLTVREERHGRLGVLIDKFSDELKIYKRHVFNIKNQQTHYRNIKENLKENETMIHIDFSENFVCKLSTEIQSMHFGASQKQVTLHTGVYYIGQDEKAHCFSAVSDSLDHGPSAIWTFLDPVLNEIQSTHPKIDTVHFYSDGPTTQYRQKGNFYLFTKHMSNRGIKYATWNFHESGHGKGVPDGVGAAVKRAANRFVLQGIDIPNASAFVKTLKEKGSNVTLFEVSREEVDKNEKIFKSLELKSVPGTFKLHQIITKSAGQIKYRDVSCSCTEGEEHEGHELKAFTFKLKNSAEKPILEQTSKPNKSTDNSNKNQDHERGAKEPEHLEIGVEHDNDARQIYFSEMLDMLEQCRTYKDIETICREHKNNVEKYELDQDYVASILNTGLPVDDFALQIYPTDTQQTVALFPVQITGDGNCLPYCGSIHAFGNEERSKEIRVRIIMESVLHKDMYLNQEYLVEGTVDNKNKHIAKSFAMYSDEYIPGIFKTLNNDDVDTIYQKEIIKVSKNKTYMGIWQIFSLSSVLGRPIFSVYPKLGNVNVRRDLHRLVEPREKKLSTFIYIMWTSTRTDMRMQHWVPNHFVAVLPVDAPTVSIPIELQRWRLMRQRKLAKEKLEKQNGNETQSRVNIEESDQNNQKDIKQSTSTVKSKEEDESNENITMDDENETESACNNIESNTIKNDEDDFVGEKDKELLRSDDVLQKYVIVRYKGKLYPGFVQDIDDGEAFIRCMHKAGKNFYWPKAVVDECWYCMSNVLAIIPEPQNMNGKYHIDSEIWERTEQKLKDYKNAQ